MATISGLSLVTKLTLILWRGLLSIDTIDNRLSTLHPSNKVVVSAIRQSSGAENLLETPWA
jgi:hypothetical protein